jgi:hypothetical protein
VVDIKINLNPDNRRVGVDQEIRRNPKIERSNNMPLCDIGWAISQLKSGRRVRREGWNGKGMWLELQTPDENSKMTLPYIYIEYPQGHPAYPNGSRVPWLASQTDILAEDWETVD